MFDGMKWKKKNQKVSEIIYKTFDLLTPPYDFNGDMTYYFRKRENLTLKITSAFYPRREHRHEAHAQTGLKIFNLKFISVINLL